MENAILDPEFKLNVVTVSVLAAVIPLTVIIPVELSPMFNVSAVILPNSASVIVIAPAVAPRPIVLLPRMFTVPELEIVPPLRLKSSAVIVSALLPVERVPPVISNVPVPPFPAVKLDVPAVVMLKFPTTEREENPEPKSIPVALASVRFPVPVSVEELNVSLPVSAVTVTPLPKLLLPPFTVSALKVELLEKLTLEALAVVKLTVVTLLLFAAVIPSTVMLPVELLPIFRVPAVTFPNSASEIVMLPAVPPNPIVPPSETAIVVDPVPLLTDPESVTSFAVRVSELLPVDKVFDALSVKSPAPLPSLSAVMTVAPAVVKSSFSVMSPVEVRVNAPVPVIPPEVVDIVKSPPAVNVTPDPKSIPVAPVRVNVPALVRLVELKVSFPVSVITEDPEPKLVLPPLPIVNALKVELLEKLTLEAHSLSPV